MPGGKKYYTVSHQGDSQTSQDAEVEGKNPTTHLNNPYNPTTLLIEGPIATSISPPARALALKWPPTLPQGFIRVMVCLKTPEIMEVGWEMPMGSMSIGLVLTPGISSVSSSHVVKDDRTGLVYMDTVTTSIGRVILGKSDLNEGPVIEDITDQS